MRVLNSIIKYFSGLMIFVSAGLALWDLWHMQFLWGLIMVGCFFLNLNTYKKCCADE